MTKIPNQDIRVSDSLLEQSAALLAFIAIALRDAAREVKGATDWDMREAIQALIRTWKTIQSGLYYDTRPENQYAARIAQTVKQRIEDIRREERREQVVSAIRDSDILAILAFLQRWEYSTNNGRKYCRAFLDFLQSFQSPEDLKAAGAPELEHPRIIL